MKCPKCRLENPPTTQRCDCGYDFVAKEMRQSYLGASGAQGRPPVDGVAKPVVTYDAQIIVVFAESLYRQASTIVATYTVLGVLAGGFGGAVLATAIHSDSRLIGVGIGALVVGIVGYSIGQQKAFGLRLQAQVALCQVQIEANTRAEAATRRGG